MRSQGSDKARTLRVSLDVFDGPLDLLLHLVREQKLGIATVPLATVAQQYFDYIAVVEALDVEIAAEYLVIAASLVYLKSKSLLPPIPTEFLAEGEETPEEVEERLRRRLVAYSKYNGVAEELRARHEEAQAYVFRDAGDPTSELVQRYRILPDKLAAALLAAIRSAKPEKRAIARERFSMARQMEVVQRAVREHGYVEFFDLCRDYDRRRHHRDVPGDPRTDPATAARVRAAGARRTAAAAAVSAGRGTCELTLMRSLHRGPQGLTLAGPRARIPILAAAVIVASWFTSVRASADESMQKAIDATLSTHGFGKVCLDGPDAGFPIGVSNDSDSQVRARVKELQSLGFIRVQRRVPMPLENEMQTQYALTPSGKRDFTSYQRIGITGIFHGWCFAEYRVGRIAKNTTPVDFMGRRVTSVSYYPRVIRIAGWADSPQAKGIPEIRALGSFTTKPLQMGLVQTSDGWEGADF